MCVLLQMVMQCVCNIVCVLLQMVWESGCVVVVMLTPLSENSVKQCYHYWPDEGSNLYHIYEVLYKQWRAVVFWNEEANNVLTVYLFFINQM